jgi:hypothetical protein
MPRRRRPAARRAAAPARPARRRFLAGAVAFAVLARHIAPRLFRTASGWVLKKGDF